MAFTRDNKLSSRNWGRPFDNFIFLVEFLSLLLTFVIMLRSVIARLVKSPTQWRHTIVTWLSYQKWSGVLLVSTTVSSTMLLKSRFDSFHDAGSIFNWICCCYISLKWLDIISVNSLSHTRCPLTVVPVSVLPTLAVSFLWSKFASPSHIHIRFTNIFLDLPTFTTINYIQYASPVVLAASCLLSTPLHPSTLFAS